jgi:IS30 family transposase
MPLKHRKKKGSWTKKISNQLYNSTPRKGLKWLTPDEVFQKNINRVALQT